MQALGEHPHRTVSNQGALITLISPKIKCLKSLLTNALLQISFIDVILGLPLFSPIMFLV